MREFFVFVVFVSSVAANCVTLHCPDLELRNNEQCGRCGECVRKAMRFCVSTRNQSCDCASSIHNSCRQQIGPDHMYSFCFVRGTTTIPRPIIRPQGSEALSVTIPRFFSQPPVNSMEPQDLTLVSRFYTQTPATCKDFHSVKAEKRGEKECVYRIKMAMPGFDHKTDDHYYYDDGSDLEATFSKDLFDDAKAAGFWIDITLKHEEKITGNTFYFYQTASSPVEMFLLQRSPPPPLRPGNFTY